MKNVAIVTGLILIVVGVVGYSMPQVKVTDGPDGELREFEVAYTFGVEPLQQYLVELDNGRLQALSLCWDTRPAAAGGQRDAYERQILSELFARQITGVVR